MRWSALPNKPKNITVEGNVSEQTILDCIDDARKKNPFVIVDLEGVASALVTFTIAKSDLVVIPVQGSQLDAEEAVKAIKLVRQAERAGGRKIPFALVFTRTSSAIQPRTFKHILAEFEKGQVPIFNSQILDREAFRALFSIGGTLRTLDKNSASNLDSAIANAEAFAAELIGFVRASKNRKLAA
ncbi:MAG: ParA family protein [Rhodospirillales bacterium]|nr:ParA family protein [Rhodospirillales bacterium]